MKPSVVKFNADELKKVLFENLSREQTRRLIEYAARKIRLLGDASQMYHSKHHMDRTGNLLDSLCWGVMYKGRLQACGFYRNQQRASKQSYLHEFWPDISWMYPIYGRGEAEMFLKNVKFRNSGMTWSVFFAILAPYWGYWESGFTLKRGRTKRHLQFRVMAKMYDDMSADLRPAKPHMHIEVNREQYQHKARKYKKRFNKKPHTTAERLRDSRAAEKRYFKNYYKKHAKFRKRR